MARIIAPIVLSLILPACSISPPSTLFASLADNDGTQAQAARERVRNEPQEKREASVGGSISSAWDSVKASLGFDNEPETKPERPISERISELNPTEASQLVNAYRARQGLKPLRLNTQLSDAASAHSRDLAKNDRISHYGSDGSDTWDRVRRAGYTARLTAENVGTGQLSLREVFQGWQKSPDHNANLLLADAEEMGIAMVHNPKTQFKTFWTLVIGSPVSVQ
jgi:uncharacterized protein YkwD